MAHAKSFRELIVYQKSQVLAQEIFAVTSRFPREETYSLTDQVRRSLRSVGAQIAEAWGKRRYEKHFISKLTDADGEQQETQHWIKVAFDCEYLTRAQADTLLEQCMKIGQLLGGMIQKAGMFCNPDALSLREDQASYFTTATDTEYQTIDH